MRFLIQGLVMPEIALSPATSVQRKPGLIRRFFRALRLPTNDPFAVLGLIIYAVFLVTAIFADHIAPYDPTEILYTPDYDLASDLRPGEDGFVLGTTSLGRDIFSQMVYGTRSALLIGITAAFMVALIGSVVGLVAGYFGGWVDAVLMRLADIAFGIPFLPFVIVLAAFLEPSIWNVVLAMALVLWRDTGRVIRSQVLTLRSRGYVDAARVSGSSDFKIILRHIAPNILPLSFLYGSIAIGWAILTEASISFLGFGDPQSISWGYMLQDAFASQALAKQAYYWFVPPGICIILVVSAGFFITRGYENILFPKLGR
jgi:peptide/nickel transport system permease protein